MTNTTMDCTESDTIPDLLEGLNVETFLKEVAHPDWRDPIDRWDDRWETRIPLSVRRFWNNLSLETKAVAKLVAEAADFLY